MRSWRLQTTSLQTCLTSGSVSSSSSVPCCMREASRWLRALVPHQQASVLLEHIWYLTTIHGLTWYVFLDSVWLTLPEDIIISQWRNKGINQPRVHRMCLRINFLYDHSYPVIAVCTLSTASKTTITQLSLLKCKQIQATKMVMESSCSPTKPSCSHPPNLCNSKYYKQVYAPNESKIKNNNNKDLQNLLVFPFWCSTTIFFWQY